MKAVATRSKPVPPPPPDTVNIFDIPYADACVLERLLRRVGGLPSGPRGVQIRLRDALNAAGIHSRDSDYWISGGIQIEALGYTGDVVYGDGR